MDITEKMLSGALFLPSDESLMRRQAQCLELQYEYNQTRPSETEKRQMLLKRMFAQIGDGCYIEPPLRANWAGAFCRLGKNVYANFNLTMVDDTCIEIGDNTMIGPNVTLATAGHPLCPELREKGYQYNAPIHIGRNCWLGAGVIVLPGVTIGDNTVIGAGSVVTKDIPADVVAAGSPCRVLRPIGQRDREYYFRDRSIDWNALAAESL